jgi:small GTP-binding protein
MKFNKISIKIKLTPYYRNKQTKTIVKMQNGSSDESKPKMSKIPKICLIGDSAVGKTSIINRFVKDSFAETQPSIGACHNRKKVYLQNNEELDVEIWDTAGQERFKSIVPMYYKGSKAIIIVFDITNNESFDGARKWIEDLKNHNHTAILSLIGNKVDLQESRKVSYEIAKLYSVQNNLLYFEVSAKLNHNVHEAFMSVIEKIPLNQEVQKEENLGGKGLSISGVDKEKTTSYCCSR